MKARKIAGLDPAAPLGPNARRIVATRLDEMRWLAEQALASDAHTAQHDMRIAAKRLRYALEILGPCIGEPAGPARRAAKEIQSVLGDLHDCDVIMPRVEAIPSLAVAVHARRECLFGEFTRLWASETCDSAWAALEAAL